MSNKPARNRLNPDCKPDSKRIPGCAMTGVTKPSIKASISANLR